MSIYNWEERGATIYLAHPIYKCNSKIYNIIILIKYCQASNFLKITLSEISVFHLGISILQHYTVAHCLTAHNNKGQFNWDVDSCVIQRDTRPLPR